MAAVHTTDHETRLELGSDLVVHAARLVRQLRRDHALPGGVRVLSLLDEHGPLTVTALAALDQCAQPTMSAAVGRLAGQELVTKRPHPDDARSSVVALTARGAADLADVRRANGDDVRRRLAGRPDPITTDELATAVAVLRAVLEDPERNR